MALNLWLPTMYSSSKPLDGEMGSLIGATDMFVWERKGSIFEKSQLFDDMGMEDSYVFFGRDRSNDHLGSCELIANDILDLLPSDPFGMDLSVAMFTEIADWIEDFEVGSQLNVIMSREMAEQSENGNVSFAREREGSSFVLGANDSYPSLKEGVGLGEGNDILDVLPSDPFGMDLSVATFNAIMDWLEDIEMESGLNLFWNGPVSFKTDGASMSVHEILESSWLDQLNSLEELGFMDGSCNGDSESFWDVEECFTFDDEDTSQFMSHRAQDQSEQAESCSDRDSGAPHDALLLSLGHLELKDLLSAERVCRSFCSAIRDDPLLWRSIHVDQPLNERIKDDDLLKLTGRAQGMLQSLSLPDCSRITDDGIRRVFECNPTLSKLSVPRCTRLSVGGLLNNLKAFQSKGNPGIKCLRIGGLYGVTQQHFEELRLLLNADKCKLSDDARKPQFFHFGYSFSSHSDEWPIDIEMCPRCQKLRLVYDCPVQSCQAKQNAAELCRACTFCIARCVQCGRCINDSEYEETFCLDLLCLGCWKQPILC